MKKILALVVLLTSCTIYAQTKFEKGYFITTEGNKIECLIKNEDWYGIPSEIKYKLEENSKISTITEKSLSKVYLKGKLLLERHNVLIDRYSKNLKELTNSRITNYKEESLLLKVIVDGKARLLKYVDKGVQYFYYQFDSEIKPLEYKLYKDSKGRLGKNLNYQKTLREELNCDKVEQQKSVKYTEIDLTEYFINYNECNNNTNEVYTYSRLAEGGKINLRGKVSFGQTNITNYPSQFSTQFGLELEYVLPFFNNTVSVFTEPTYQSYSYKNMSQIIIGYDVSVPVPSTGETVTTPIFGTEETNINYSSIELPFGVRKYFLLNNSSKIFLNVGFNFSNTLNKEFRIKIENNETNIPIESRISYLMGFGYEFKNKISAEIRYVPNRFINSDNQDSTTYSNFSLKLGYNFLN